MKKYLTSACAAALFVAAMPAQAGTLAEPIVEPIPIAPIIVAPDWTGPYFGVNGGGGVFTQPAPDVTYWDLGAHAGYLYDMGNWVLGAEVSFEYMWPSVPVASAYRFNGDLILGYDAGSVMPHVTLGGSALSVNGNPFRFGVSAGAGASVMATDNIMLTGRYRYTWYMPGGSDHSFKVMASLKF